MNAAKGLITLKPRGTDIFSLSPDAGLPQELYAVSVYVCLHQNNLAQVQSGADTRGWSTPMTLGPQRGPSSSRFSHHSAGGSMGRGLRGK